MKNSRIVKLSLLFAMVLMLALSGCKDEPVEEDVVVTTIELKALTVLDVNEEETLTATIKPNKAESAVLSWTSSDTDVVAVDNAGKLTAKAFGTATITVTVVDGSEKSAGCVVVVEDLALVEGGTFNNGTADVTVSSFNISKYELTQDEYVAIIGSNPSKFQGDTYLPIEGEIQGKRPVENVNWYDALIYCNKLSIAEGLTPCYKVPTSADATVFSTNPDTWGEVPKDINDANCTRWNEATCDWNANGYRLPTEAEWEFAARGGNSTHSYTYSGSDAAYEVAWYTESASHEVGKKAANELGLYDMSGNVVEWCWDWYGTYSNEASLDPTGPDTPSLYNNSFWRITRGGSWKYDETYTTVSYRTQSGKPAYRREYIGFRVVRPVTE